MGDQKEPLLPPQVGRHLGPAPGVQVVGGLVDQRNPPRLQEQGRQQHLGPLPLGQGGKGPLQGLRLQPQQRQLPLHLPALRGGTQPGEHRLHRPGRVGDRGGEIAEPGRGLDAPPVLQLPHQQPEQGGLAPAVAAHQPQLPVGVQLQADVLKYIAVSRRVAKGEMLNLNDRHDKTTPSPPRTVPERKRAKQKPAKKQTAAGTSVPAALAQHPPAQHGRAAKHSSPGVGRLYGRAQKDRFRSCKARQTGDRAPLFRPPSRAGMRSPGTSPRQIPSFAGSRNHPFTSFVVFQRQYTMPDPARQAPAR